ncbi:MAG: hypothetical protein ACM3L5_00655, partial [Candidatus Saccharibacteria bacterium]
LSHEVLMATLGNPNYQKQGVRLADVYMNMTDRDVGKAKKVMAYIEAVNKMDFPAESVDRKTEKMVRAALELPSGAQSTIGIMQNLEVGIYTARRIVSILKTFDAGTAVAPRHRRAHESAPLPEELPEPVEEKRAKQRPEAVEHEDDAEEPRAMFRKKKKEVQPVKPVDRSNAINVNFNPTSEQYHGRKCLFHGEGAVSVCPNCGTLFCMDCVTHLNACPRCRVAINFVDASQIPADKDDRDVIETESQRKAIQQRWAMKRLAEADSNKVKEKSYKALVPDKDQQIEKLMRQTTQRYNSSPAQEPPAEVYQPSVETFQPQAVEEPEVEEQPEAVEEPSPEEIPAEERAAPAVNKKADEKKEKLRELLESDQEDGESTRDMSRL